MTRIEYRDLSSRIPKEPFPAKPRILYTAGTTYSRIEEQPDPTRAIHGLIIVNEPDVWMVNLLDRRAQHFVDRGPTFVVHHNVLPRHTSPNEFAPLEFGKELDFFRSKKAKTLPLKSVDGQRCKPFELRHYAYRLVLYVRTDKSIPFQLEIFKDEKNIISVRYMSYQTGLPFNQALFKPPPDVAITEGKANSVQ